LVEEAAVVASAGQWSFNIDHKSKRVNTDEIVLCVSVFICAVKCALFMCWLLDFTMGAIQYRYGLVVHSQPSMQVFPLFCSRPVNEVVQCGNDACSYMIDDAVEGYRMKGAEQVVHCVERGSFGVIEPQEQLFGRIELGVRASRAMGGRSVFLSAALQCRFEDSVEQEEFCDRQTMFVEEFDVVLENGGNGCVLRAEPSSGIVDVEAGRMTRGDGNGLQLDHAVLFQHGIQYFLCRDRIGG